MEDGRPRPSRGRSGSGARNEPAQWNASQEALSGV